jgi:hypothetical protein
VFGKKIKNNLINFIFIFRRLNDNLNLKSQEEQSLNSKLYELERKNIVLATQSQEVRQLVFFFILKFFV